MQNVDIVEEDAVLALLFIIVNDSNGLATAVQGVAPAHIATIAAMQNGR
jgi:hypothetical protein